MHALRISSKQGPSFPRNSILALCTLEKTNQTRITNPLIQNFHKDHNLKPYNLNLMDKLRDVTMKLFQSAGSTEQKSSVHAHITSFISGYRTPDHPPYAAMIHRAIEELNEKRGSSEESLSRYIRKQYTDLPLAHNTLLKHHLGELCNSGEILVTGKHLYLLPGTNPTPELKRTRKVSGRISKKDEEFDKPNRKRARRGRGRIGKKGEGSNKHRKTHGKAKEGTDRCNKEKETQDIDSPLQVEESPQVNMEIDYYVNYAQETAAVSASCRGLCPDNKAKSDGVLGNTSCSGADE